MLSDTEAVVSIRGVFDPSAAARLRAECMELARTNTATVVVDFSHAREITDVALAVLIEQEAANQEPRLILRGLSQRHNRLLRYLDSSKRESRVFDRAVGE